MSVVSDEDILAKAHAARLKTQRADPKLPVHIQTAPIIEIDPHRAKPWRYHNRDAAWLNVEHCQDLICSIQRNNQLEPVLVRALKEDPNHDFEIIYGVRRWFACTQIPNRRLLVRVTEADDKTCMVLMHTENADSKDISEFERAFSFSEQMKSGVFKNQHEMAKAMGLTQGLISRLIKAAKIFDYDWIRELFPSKLGISVISAYRLASLLEKPQHFPMIRAEVELILKELSLNAEQPSPLKTMQRLIKASQSSVFNNSTELLLGSGVSALVSSSQDLQGDFHLKVSKQAKTLSYAQVQELCLKALRDYYRCNS
jgi:ParB family chromosome partitioning protein